MPANRVDRIGMFILVIGWLVETGFGQAPNHLFANRIELVGTNLTVEGNSAASDWQVEPGEPGVNAFGTPLEYTVWYSWTAPSNGRVELFGGNSRPGCFHMNLIAYKGDSVATLTPVPPDEAGKISVRMGDTLQLQVSSAHYLSSTPCPGPFTLRLLVEPPLPSSLMMDQSQTVGGLPWCLRGGLTANSSAQTFTPAVSGQLYRVMVLGNFRSGTPLSMNVVEVVDGLPGTNVLGRAVVPRSMGQYLEFIFAGGSIFLTAGKVYAFTLSTDSPVSGISEYCFMASTSNLYTRGELFFQVPGSAWEPTGVDQYFATYMLRGIPPIRIVAPTNGRRFQVADSITISAEPAPEREPPMTVQFFSGNELLGTASQPPYAITWSPSQLGAYDLTATLADQSGQTFTSEVIRINLTNPRPPNDDFGSRTVLSGDYANVPFTTVNASLEASESRPFPNSVGGSVWWSWTAARTGFVSVDVLEPSRDNAALAVYTGSAFDVLQNVTNAVGHCSFLATAGQQYSIAADGLAHSLDNASLVLAQSDVEITMPTAGKAFTAPASVSIGATRTGMSRVLTKVEFYFGDAMVGTLNSEPYQLTAQLSVPGRYQVHLRAYDNLGLFTESMLVPIVIRPENDDFENALVIGGHTVTIHTSNVEATLQLVSHFPEGPPTGEPTYAQNQGGHSIWYKWTAPRDGYCTISGAGQGFGLLLGAYLGTSVTNLSLVAVNAFNGGGTLGFYAYTGTTYCIAIDSGKGEEGNLVWSLHLRPMNDDFAARTLIDGASYEVIVSQQGAGLEAGEGSAPGFVATDFLNVSSLANQLWTHGDLLSQYLWKQFSASDQQLLAPTSSDSQLLAVLLSNFNNIIVHAWLYDYHRFEGIVLSSTTTDLVARGAQGDEVARLNRLLLEDFYPRELAKLQVNSAVVPLNANSSLWWRWKAPVSGPVTVSVHSASAGSQISVFTGESSSVLVKVTSTETWATASELRFNAIEGTTYQIAVFGQMNPVGDISFSLIPSGARLLNPLDGSVFASAASLQLRAQVDDMGAPVIGIEFYANDQLIGTVAQPPYFLTWDNMAPGTYRLLVRAKAEQGYVGSSPPVTILVAANSTPDTPRIFAGPFSDCSYVLNALGELRVLGKVGWQFGLAPTDDLLFPQLASWPVGVRKWSWIGAGSPFLFWNVPYSQSWNSVDCPSWALSDLGELYLAGWKKISFPNGVSKWVDVAPGSGGVLAVGDDGQIYLDGQSLVQLAAKGIPWKSVAFGGNVLFTLSSDGRAYEHGRGLYGEALSLLIPFPASVTQWVRMRESLNENYLQGQDNEIYWIGGKGLSSPPSAPLLVERPAGVSRWTDFCAGGYHMLALGSNGQLYSWGRNWEGQLGLGTGGGFVASPTAVLLPPGVTGWKTIAAGYKHSLAVGDDCSLYAWGDNSFGQLGNGSNLGQTRPTPTATLRGLCGVPVVFAEGEATQFGDGSFRVQFKSDLNRSYLVQYSEDLLQWKTSFPALTGTGGTLEWIDDGPPKTDSPPASQSQRLYRLVYAR